MKKTVIIILAILPIVLLVTIGFAGQVLKHIVKIPVTEVCFVDPVGTVYEPENIFELGIGEDNKKATRVLIKPLNANDQAVTYKSSDENVCTIDEQGILCGIAPGTAVITVTTHDGNKEAILNVWVKAEVIGITLPSPTLELTVGENGKLNPTVIYPEAPAADKRVSYFSSNTSVVTVDVNGNLKALSVGTATITLSTADGKHTTTCMITVVPGIPPLSFDFSSADWIYDDKGVYVASQHEINLFDFVRFDPEKVELSQIQFKIRSGNSRGNIENGVLSITGDGPIKLMAYVGDEKNPTFYVEIFIQRI